MCTVGVVRDEQSAVVAGFDVQHNSADAGAVPRDNQSGGHDGRVLGRFQPRREQEHQLASKLETDVQQRRCRLGSLRGVLGEAQRRRALCLLERLQPRSAHPLHSTLKTAYISPSLAVANEFSCPCKGTGSRIREALSQDEQGLCVIADVTSCEPDILVNVDAGSASPNDPSYSQQWNMPNIQMPTAWKTGQFGSQSVRTCVIDTGVDFTHPDLINNLWRNPKEVAGSGATSANGYMNGADDDKNGAPTLSPQAKLVKNLLAPRAMLAPCLVFTPAVLPLAICDSQI